MSYGEVISPSFFDVMVHLTIHLVEELFIYGPVHVKSMYPYERYFKTLKRYVRNLAKPEGCMAKGYEVVEACGFVFEYFGEGHDYLKKVWESEEDPSMTIANFNRMIEFGADSFTFPNHVEQVFNADCNDTPGWKVVIRTEPRGIEC